MTEIYGPESSGKTTFAKRLTIQLLAHGISPFSFELDNYFVDRDQTPLDEDGEYDFESLQALDLKQLAHDLKHLIAGESIQMPNFNFVTGQREIGEVAQLDVALERVVRFFLLGSKQRSRQSQR